MATINLQRITVPSVPGRELYCFTPSKGSFMACAHEDSPPHHHSTVLWLPPKIYLGRVALRNCMRGDTVVPQSTLAAHKWVVHFSGISVYYRRDLKWTSPGRNWDTVQIGQGWTGGGFSFMWRWGDIILVTLWDEHSEKSQERAGAVEVLLLLVVA